MKAQNLFLQDATQKIKTAISAIPPAVKKEIYALSFWYYTDKDDPRYPKIAISYNTESHLASQIAEASSKAEAKWNYAFWLQEEIAGIGGAEDALLAAWFREMPEYFSEAEESATGEDEALFEKLLAQGTRFDAAFIEVVIQLTQNLFSEGFVAAEFGKNIPILIHELEYYDVPMEWTVEANPAGLVNDFVLAFTRGEL